MKKRKTGKISVVVLSKIYALREKGFAPAETAELIGIGYSTVKNYYRVFTAIEEGQEIDISEKRYCAKTVAEWCGKNNIEYKPPVEEKPMQTRLDIISANDLAKASPDKLIDEDITQIKEEGEAILDAVLHFYDHLAGYIGKLNNVLLDINSKIGGKA